MAEITSKRPVHGADVDPVQLYPVIDGPQDIEIGKMRLANSLGSRIVDKADGDEELASTRVA